MKKLLKQAFTLIELLVVIAIIGILSGLIIVGMNGMTQRATIAKAQVFSSSLRNSLMMNLVSEWKFDNVSGTVDSPLVDGTSIPDSWSINNGLTAGGPTLKNEKDCVSGKCLSFDGNDSVNCGNNVSIGLNSFTFAFWGKTSVNSAGQTAIKRIAAITGWRGSFFLPYLSTRNVLFYITDSDYTAGSIYRYLDVYNDSSNTTNGQWHYFVGTCDRSQHKPPDVYLDGVLKNGSSAGYCNELTTDIPAGNLFIGSDGSSSYFNGLIDDVRVYNVAMPVSQIKEQYYIGLNKLLKNEAIETIEYKKRILDINNLAKK